MSRAWLDDGEPSSQSFFPWRDVDDDCMSVDRHPAHALVEFAPLTKKQQRSLERKLKLLAIARGRLHP